MALQGMSVRTHASVSRNPLNLSLSHRLPTTAHAPQGTSFLIRGKGDWIRAFLSADYVAYNNREIGETVEALLAKGDITIKDFVLEETNMFLKLVSNEIWDVESGLKAGIMIGNSEVGM